MRGRAAPEAGAAALSPIEVVCRGKGVRLTRQRRLIAQAFAEAAGDYPDMSALHRRVAARDAGVSLATVYRTIARLERAGIVKRYVFRDGRARLALASEAPPCHLVDLETGRVIPLRDETIEDLHADLARRLGYRLVERRVELYAVPLRSD